MGFTHFLSLVADRQSNFKNGAALRFTGAVDGSTQITDGFLDNRKAKTRMPYAFGGNERCVEIIFHRFRQARPAILQI